MTMLTHVLEVSSIEWQVQLVSMRAEVAYMQVELPKLEAEGRELTDIDDWIARFIDASNDFLAAELNAYAEARRYDLGETDIDELVELIALCKTALYPWLQQMHEIVQRRQAESGEPGDSPLMLLMACGAEMLKAHKQLMNSVDALIEAVKRAV